MTPPRTHLRPRTRAAVFCGVLGSLFGLSFAAGELGAFSSAEHNVERAIADPDTRLHAVSSVADRVAAALGDGHPTVPGARAQQTCPASYAARATTIIGALEPTAAARTEREAARRLAAAGWRIHVASAAAARPTVTATNRHGLEVTVVEEPGADQASVQVTVTAPCQPPPAVSVPGGTSPGLPTTGPGAAGGP